MTSALAKIEDFPAEPVEMFQRILQAAAKRYPDGGGIVEMNLATVDEEYGVLNRTVLYRGLTTDNYPFYITHRFTRNFKNLASNPRASLTFYFTNVPDERGQENTWQVRLIGAQAVQLPDSEMDALWSKEELPAQIRGRICPTGEPIDYAELKVKHDKFLQDHLASGKAIERPATYTAWKFLPQRWDFMKVGIGEIADRVQYRLQANGKWESMHVAT